MVKLEFNYQYAMLVKPKKSLGQHFLKNENIAEKIANTLANFSDFPILEIGPGMGVLTKFLVDKYKDVKVIEIDSESVDYLNKNLYEIRDKIIKDDFLKINLRNIYTSPFCIIGNYPYNISSQIFFKVIEHKDMVVCCSGMIQKEVAERIASKEGSKTYGILSIFLQCWFDVEYLFTVDENNFIPAPKVKSAVIRIIRNKRNSLNCDENLFKKIVKTCFNQRRKMIRNSIRSLLEGKEISDNDMFNKRPEQLSIEQFEELTNKISSIIG